MEFILFSSLIYLKPTEAKNKENKLKNIWIKEIDNL